MNHLSNKTKKNNKDDSRAAAAREWLKDRQRGRTDLMYLCREVLGYPDFDDRVHGPVFAHLQQFRGCEEYIDPGTMRVVFSEPICAWHSPEVCNEHEGNRCPPKCESRGCKYDCLGRTCWALDGPRFRTLFDPRGFLKTTGNTIAHSIQWVINFRDIRIALGVYEGVFGGEIITEIESHFRSNERFRFVYPEFCPPTSNAARFGNLEGFTVPCRRRKQMKEPTIKVVARGQAAAGPHYEVHKLCDLVNKENAYTDGGLKETKRHFRFMMPMLERGPKIPGRPLTRGWVDLEGTIYNNSDLYVEQIEKDDARQKSGKPGRWVIFKRDAIQDEQIWARALKGEKIEEQVAARAVLWHKRFPIEELLAIREDMDEFTFNCQYRLNPYSRSRGLASRAEVLRSMIPHKLKKEMMPRYWTIATFDLAGMDEEKDSHLYSGGGDEDTPTGEKSNSAGCVAGHLGGQVHILDALVGRPSPIEIIDIMFEWAVKYNLKLIKVEKNHHAEILMPFLRVAMETRKQWLPVIAIPRDTSTSKDNRILGTQPFFRRNLIRFYDDVPHMEHILREIENFPYFRFKDFLDTLSDQFRNEKGEVDQAVIPREKIKEYTWRDRFGVSGKFIGFSRENREPVWSDGEGSAGNRVGRMDEESIIGAL